MEEVRTQGQWRYDNEKKGEGGGREKSASSLGRGTKLQVDKGIY